MAEYLTVKEASLLWNVSERSVRHYCAQGRVEGAKNENGIWRIPASMKKPQRTNEKKNKNYLLERLRLEKSHGLKGGIYHKLQIDFAYNSNHMEGSKLTHEETRYIYETRAIGLGEPRVVRVDDIIETVNHFSLFDRVIDFACYPLSEAFAKELHRILKTGTADARLPYFAVGEYKRVANTVGSKETAHPRLVPQKMKELFARYREKESHTLEEIIEFHAAFERIHPFQDGNGRVGRMIAFKECLCNNIVPFLILDGKKSHYYRGLANWDQERGRLIDTCLDGQDTVKGYLDYFEIRY